MKYYALAVISRSLTRLSYLAVRTVGHALAASLARRSPLVEIGAIWVPPKADKAAQVVSLLAAVTVTAPVMEAVGVVSHRGVNAVALLQEVARLALYAQADITVKREAEDADGLAVPFLDEPAVQAAQAVQLCIHFDAVAIIGVGENEAPALH